VKSVKVLTRKSAPPLALVALAACLVSSASAQTTRPPTDAEVHARRAAAHRVRGDLALAIAEYDKAIKADPNAAEIYARRGGARRANGDAEGALEDFDRAYSLDPRAVQNDRGVADAFSSRGFVRASRLDLSGALADFDKAIACYQGNPDFYFKRGQTRLIKGDTAGAISDIDAGLALKPDDKLASIAYAVRGYAHVLRHEEAEARSDFAQSIKLNRAGKFFLHMHLRTLESQADEYKQLRARDDQRITE
jgi:tetratricopeptide (TPR) repeat protein